ncbi:MAG: SAM-dependent methyltransferase [Noviherbaspirillum sp.]
MAGILYLVPNLLEQAAASTGATLAGVIPETVQATTARLEYFIAENAKTTRAFLKLLGQARPLAKPLQEIRIAGLDVNTPAEALPGLLAPILAGQDGGLISEAGVPAVADPGANLVRLAHERGIRVKPLVGPSSLLLALMASGLNGQRFAFHGYLPVDAAERARRIKALEERSRQEHQTQLFIETPYRNLALLQALASACRPQTLVSVATDLSLPDEWVRTQSAERWRRDLEQGKEPPFHKRPTVFLMLA